MPHDSTPRSTARAAGPLQSLLKRDRTMVIAGLLGVTAMSSAYLVCSSGIVKTGMTMKVFDAVTVPHFSAWTLKECIVMGAIWALMMLGLMLPRAAPTILFYAFYVRKQREIGRAVPSPAFFVCGCLVAWIAFCFAATAAQWELERWAVASALSATTSKALGGMVLIAAGFYQVSEFRHVHQRRCLGPLRLMMQEWLPGIRGTFLMGAQHGLDGVCRCWAPMALLFAGGAMNLVWAAATAVFVLADTLAPRGRVVPWLSGTLLVLWGGMVLVR
jgi:predicted metal-binding membrane protein